MPWTPRFDDLRRGAEKHVIGRLTDAAKTIVAAQMVTARSQASHSGVESETRAETLIESLRYFLRASTETHPRSDGVACNRSASHLRGAPEILESRALALWHFVNGDNGAARGPVSAALGRYRHTAAYAELAPICIGTWNLPPAELVEHLEATGYARGEMVEMPGQYAQPAASLTYFQQRLHGAIRIELLGDAVESLREFDPDTQRSFGPSNAR